MAFQTKQVADQFSQLRNLYSKKLPILVADIEMNYANLEQGRSKNFSEFQRKIHSLIGSSGTFGFFDVSASARSLENYLVENVEECKQKSKPRMDEIWSYLTSIKSLTQRGQEMGGEAEDFPSIDIGDMNIPELNILIASDDDDIKSKLNIDLSIVGHRRQFVDNGREALEYYLKNNVDLLIIEISMPIMDGYSAVNEIRNEHKDRYTPIIFLTASNRKSDLLKCIECGGDDFIQKPYDSDLLNSKLYALDRIVRNKL